MPARDPPASGVGAPVHDLAEVDDVTSGCAAMNSRTSRRDPDQAGTGLAGPTGTIRVSDEDDQLQPIRGSQLPAG